MSSQSPSIVLYSSDGYELSVSSGSVLPVGSKGILIEGSDGVDSRFISVDTSGRLVSVGAGTAGSPVGGVITIQGIAGGTAVPISGSVTTTIASVGGTGATAPSSADLSGALVVTSAPTYVAGNMQAITITTSGLLRVDGSGVTQPVSGTIAATQSGTWTVQPGNTANTTPWLVTDQADGSVAPGVAASKSSLMGGQFNTALPTLTNGQQSAVQVDSSGRIIIAPLSTGANVIGSVTQSGTWTNTVTQATASNLNATVVGVGTAGTPSGGVLTIQGSASGTPLPITGTFVTDKSATGTITSVAATITSTTLLASNTNRVSATFTNDGGAILYIALAASASTTAYTIKLLPNSYWELPISYTGIVTGICNAAVGSIRITELT